MRANMERMQLSMQGMYSDHQTLSYQTSALYDASVRRGEVTPPVNYPYVPPQQGPVPSWGGDNLPTYPYWPGVEDPDVPRRDFPPYDYRVSGGSDYRGDPAYYYVHPHHPEPLVQPEPYDQLTRSQLDLFQGHYGFPPGYTGGWDTGDDGAGPSGQ